MSRLTLSEPYGDTLWQEVEKNWGDEKWKAVKGKCWQERMITKEQIILLQVFIIHHLLSLTPPRPPCLICDYDELERYEAAKVERR